MKKLFGFFIFILSFPALGQNDRASQPKVEVIGRAYKDEIKIRWSPNSPAVWELGNKYGYMVQRVTILRNNQLVSPAEILNINVEPIKPLELAKWEPLVKNNKYAAIAAQALYGKTFQLTQNYRSNMIDVANKSSEMESRFSFALYSASHSIEVANALGLVINDKRTKPNEKYLYRVFTQVPPKELSIDTGSVYISNADYKPLPRPKYFKGKVSGNSVMLTWQKKHYEDTYISFKVEKSSDGKTFKSISGDNNLINTTPRENDLSDEFYKLDTLTELNKKFFYRVCGVSYFGEQGPYSDTITCIGEMALIVNPSIQTSELLNDKTVKITWEFPKELNSSLKGFFIERSENSDKSYKAISKVLLPSEQRNFIDTKPGKSSYYRITAIGKKDERLVSFPYLTLQVDSIPPAAPLNLSGTSDTLGVVTLKWKKNKEEDIFGYKVYRANYTNEEFSLINSSIIRDSTYYDTISINTLSKNVYYKIVALDKNFNPSAFSQIHKVGRPDVIPPVAAIFTDVRGSKDGIYLKWQRSTSNDVVEYALERSELDKNIWSTVRVFGTKDTNSSYADLEGLRNGIKYQYRIITRDESNLTTPSKIAVMHYSDYGVRPKFKTISGRADRQNRQIVLNWKYDQPKIEKFLVYRAKEGEELSWYKTITEITNEFTDKSLTINTTYSYRLKAVFEDGSHSPFSDEIIVIY